jgi:hypothetical protein
MLKLALSFFVLSLAIALLAGRIIDDGMGD